MLGADDFSDVNIQSPISSRVSSNHRSRNPPNLQNAASQPPEHQSYSDRPDPSTPSPPGSPTHEHGTLAVTNLADHLLDDHALGGGGIRGAGHHHTVGGGHVHQGGGGGPAGGGGAFDGGGYDLEFGAGLSSSDEDDEAKLSVTSRPHSTFLFVSGSSILAFDESQNSKGQQSQIQISVCDPEKKGEGINAYTTYKIQTKKLGLDGSPPQQSSVDRRYSDFVWLHSQFQKKVKGIIVPPLPGKDIMRRFEPEFIEQRRKGLEIFLMRTVSHKHLRNNEDLQVFLHGDIRKLDKAKQAVEKPAEQPSTGGVLGGYLSWGWNALEQSISTTLGVTRQPEKTESDLKCDRLTDYGDSLHSSISSVDTNALSLVTDYKKLAHNWYEFSVSVTSLAQFENEQNEPGLGTLLARVGKSADKITDIYTKRADRMRTRVQEPFHDYVRIVQAVQFMMQTRQTALDEFHSNQSNLEALQQKLEDYNNTPGKEQKAVALQREIDRAKEKTDQSQKDLERITENVISEIKRFKEDKNNDIKEIVRHFVKLQIRYSQKILKEWENVLTILEPQNEGVGRDRRKKPHKRK